MASTRSTTAIRDAARPASTETPKEALTALARRTVRIQVAACTAAARALTGWAQSADHLAQTAADELLRRVDGESDSPELIARLITATNSHLRDLARLPRAAADHFDASLARAPIDN